MYIIDAHAHIFPEKIAVRASKGIGDFYDIPTQYDGTIETLLNLGDKYGIAKYLVHSVATIPEQVQSINNFMAESVKQYPDRLIGFAALHPDTKDPAAEVERAISLGLKGIKMHPDFQKFYIDDVKMDCIYSAIESKLPLLIHTGDARYEYSAPSRIVPVLERFPALDIICAHFGGWSRWDEAENMLADKRLWVDTCSTFPFISPERATELINKFGEDKVIFGCDYPMWNPGEELELIRKLNLPDKTLEKILSGNLLALLEKYDN